MAISIVGMLTAMALAGVTSSREAGRKAACANHLRQIGIALSAHQSTFGRFPPRNPAPNNTMGSSFSHQGMSWHSYILAFIDQKPLADAMDEAFQADRDPYGAAHATLSRAVVSAYICPSDSRLAVPLQDSSGAVGAFTSYIGMTGSLQLPASGVFGRRTGLSPGEIPDGLSTTIMVGERPPPGSLSMGWWYNTHRFTNLMTVTDYEAPAAAGSGPGDPNCAGRLVDWPGRGSIYCSFFSQGDLSNDCDKNHYWSLHRGGANFLMGDGSVPFMRYEAKFLINDLATVAGGEAIGN